MQLWQKKLIVFSAARLNHSASWPLLVHTARLFLEKTEEQERKRNEEEEIRRARDDHRRKSPLHPLRSCAELQRASMRQVLHGSVAVAKPWWHNSSCTSSSQACRRMRQAHRLHRMQDALA